MKKWLVTCLLAIALLFVATTAMAAHIRLNGDYCEGNTFEIRKREKDYHTLYCYRCYDEFTENHWSIDTPQYKATCTKFAVCTSCLASYGEYGPHDWGEWKSNGNGSHTRTCKHQSDHTETENCTFSTAPCAGSAACTVCGGYYSTGHDWGGWTSNGNKTHTHTCKRDSSHTETADCRNFQEANCTTPEMCLDCGGTYGETAPDKHDWEPFPNSNGDGTHTYTCDYNFTHKKTEACSGSGALSCGETGFCRYCMGEYTVSHKLDGIWASDADGHWQTCIRCNESQSKAPHSFVELADAKHLKSEATCVSGAVYYRSCSECGYHAPDTFESGDKNPNNHDLVPREYKAPTCTEEGWTAHEACQREGCCFLTPHQRLSVGHSLISHNGKTPTCTEIGWKAYKACENCDYTTYQELPINPDNHDLEHHEAKTPTCTEVGWSAYDTCKRCDYTTYQELPIDPDNHDLVHHEAKAPTCTEIGWEAYDTCSRCGYTTYRELDALGHAYEARTVQPTCTKKGHTLYTCVRCKDCYTDAFVSSRGHWYGEWSPNGDATSSADCRRNGCRHTRKALCEPLACRLLLKDAEAYDFTLCPVCGEVSDGARLTLIEEAKATAQRLPHGELVLHIGDLQNGERVLSVGFEYGGRLTQPTGQVEITLHATLLDGYALMLLDADGAETVLPYTLNGDEATFTLDFTADESPALALRLAPVSK